MTTRLSNLHISSAAIILPAIFFISCGRVAEESSRNSKSIPGKNTNEHTLSPRIRLDIDGDGIAETAEVILMRESNGNPIEGGDAAEYAVSFSNSEIPLLSIGCCDGYLISEGDLNNIEGEELSLLQSPMNGCTYTLRCFTFNDSEWTELLEPILIPSACEGLSHRDLEDRIVLEGKSVFYYENDPNDEAGGLVRKRLNP